MIRAGSCPDSGGVDCETPALVLNSSAKNTAQLRRQNRTTLLDRPSAPIWRTYATAPTLFPRYILEDICTPSEGNCCTPDLDIDSEDRQPGADCSVVALKRT